MRCEHIIEMIEGIYPREYAMNWDNVGLLAGRPEKEVSRIYVALDATDEVITQALEAKANMLVTHHPMVFSPMKRVVEDGFIGSRLIRMIREDLCYYAMHTNYDVVRMGTLAGTMMKLRNMMPLDVTVSGSWKDGRLVPGMDQGIGQIGDIDTALSLKECCEQVKKTFGMEQVKVFGNPEKKVQRIAILPGSGKSDIVPALEKGADVLITGDIDHHDGIDGAARGLAIIDAGHYGIEHIYIDDMTHFLSERLLGVEIEQAPVSYPFYYV